MSWAMQTALHSGAALLTFEEADSLWRIKTGRTADPISSDNGQSIARATSEVYGDLLENVPIQGWSEESVELWLESQWGKAIHLYCAGTLFLRDKIPLEDRFWRVAETYMRKCDAVKAGKHQLRDKNGQLLPRDTSPGSAASSIQARTEVRNQSQQELHDFYFDVWPGQLHGNDRILSQVGRRTFGNSRTGGRR